MKGAVSGITSAIEALNNISLEEGIIAQFTNLKTAINDVTSAISGGGGESSGGEGQGNSSGSSKSGESGGKGEGGGGNSLTGAITEMSETANEAIGEPGAEGDGTVIGEFGSMKTAVNDVTSAIGSGDVEGGEGSGSGEGEDSGNLIGSIVSLGETTQEELGESGGDGVIGKFEEFRDVVGEANEHVTGISDGLEAIDGQEVECTITVNIVTNGALPAFATGTALDTMNLNSAEYNAKYGGKSHYEGTALASGNWAVQSNEQSALVGEEGFEIIVRNGWFFTVGDNGAEMTNIQKGDIVFNHEQSKNLLKYGHISGRGKAYADGTVGGGKILTKDGHILRPLQLGDHGYDLMKAGETFIEKWKKSGEEFISNAYFEGQRQLEKWTKVITNNTAINNISTTNKPSVNIGDIYVTCLGVTSQQVAEQLGDALDKKLDEKFNGLHLQAIQQSMMR